MSKNVRFSRDTGGQVEVTVMDPGPDGLDEESVLVPCDEVPDLVREMLEARRNGPIHHLVIVADEEVIVL